MKITTEYRTPEIGEWFVNDLTAKKEVMKQNGEFIFDYATLKVELEDSDFPQFAELDQLRQQAFSDGIKIGELCAEVERLHHLAYPESINLANHYDINDVTANAE